MPIDNNISLQEYINRVSQINPREADYVTKNAAHLFQDWSGAAGGNFDREILSYILYQLKKAREVDSSILYGRTSLRYQDENGDVSPENEEKALDKSDQILSTMIVGLEEYLEGKPNTTDKARESLNLLATYFDSLWN